MELIIKPTGKCNFNCTFCSANLLNIKHSTNVSDKLKETIDILKPDNIIFTGGDPLMVSPDYYKEILSLGDYSISFTTNLKDFYLNSDKWIELFKNERVGIGTSFQYGIGRKWDKNTIYTEEMFINVMNKFNNLVGYMPPFISIISEDNEDKALDHLYLAKKLGTKCKLNPLLPLGLSKTFYPLYKIIDIWFQIYDLGLEKYWDNKIQFYNGGCNFNTNMRCESSIRTFWLNDKEEIQYGNCEDSASDGMRIPLETSKPLCTEKKLDINNVINNRCLYCPLSRLCNSCKTLQKMNKMTENHCDEMLKRMSKIQNLGWKI